MEIKIIAKSVVNPQSSICVSESAILHGVFRTLVRMLTSDRSPTAHLARIDPFSSHWATPAAPRKLGIITLFVGACSMFVTYGTRNSSSLDK